MKEVDTKKLQEILTGADNTGDLQQLLNREPVYESNLLLHEYLDTMLRRYTVDKSQAVERSGLHRTYAYQILQGKKQPSRDKLLALCFGIGMTLEETQRALTLAGLGILYSKDRRDAVLLFAISRSLSCIETNNLLYEFGEAILE